MVQGSFSRTQDAIFGGPEFPSLDTVALDPVDQDKTNAPLASRTPVTRKGVRPFSLGGLICISRSRSQK